MCIGVSKPKTVNPDKYAAAKTPEAPKQDDTMSGRRGTLLAGNDAAAQTTTRKKTLLGQ